MEIVAQALGVVAAGIAILSMVFKSKTNIMLFCLIYNLLTLFSYLLLGEFLGCIMVGVLTLKSLCYYFFALKKLKPNVWVLIFLEVSILTVSIVLWSSWVDVFMIANGLINTYFSWQNNVKYLKASVVLCAGLLILYDVFVGAYAYIISEVLYGATALVSLIVLLKKQNKTEECENGEG